MKVSAATILAFVAASAPTAHAFAPVSPMLPAAGMATTGKSAITSSSAPTQLWATPRDEPEILSAAAAENIRTPKNPTPVLVDAIQNLMGGAELSPGAALAAAALALMLATASPANAAMTGGRMGGSFSSPSPSMSRPAPSSSTYSRGYSSGYRSGYGSGYYSRPSVTIAPSFGFGGGLSPFYNPFSVFPRPYVFGGPGVIAYSRGPSFFDLLLIGGIGFVILNAITAARETGSAVMDGASSPWDSFLNSGDSMTSALGSGASVVQVSVALEVPNRDDPSSILSVLGRLARTAKTDSRVGIQSLTSQVALELLRRKSSIVSASTRYKHFGNREKAQRDFNTVSVKERAKFEQETVSKYGGVDYANSRGNAAAGAGDKATAAVVTLVIAIDGDSTKVPKNVDSIQDLETALRKIATDVKVDDCLQSAEILWTPEDRSETLTLRDVVADYPELRAV